MTLDAVLAYLHFVAIFALGYALLAEWLELKRAADALDVTRLARLDLAYMFAAIAVLATGAARWWYGAKTAAFYTPNPIFHAKLGLFVLVGLLSIWPTVACIRWRKARIADPAYPVPPGECRRARMLVMAELHLLALIPLLAVLMARGIGL